MVRNKHNNWRAGTFIILFFLIFSPSLFAAQVYPDKYEEARMYLDADLVIVGEVISCSTEIIEEKEISGDDEWVTHVRKSTLTYSVRVESVVKGDYTDSTISIRGASSKRDTWSSRFADIVNGDSLFEGISQLEIGGEGINTIHKSGKCIILLNKEDEIYMPTLCRVFDKSIIDFYKEIDERGEDHFKNSILSYHQEVNDVLEKAGDNRVELEKVLSHYSSEGDSLKLEATYFLISNMEGHSYIKYALRDTAGKEVDFNALNYPDYDALGAGWDTLESRYGTLDFKKKETINDLDTITLDFLINQIDYAFKAWREKPWAKSLSFEQFCEYILPYRGSNEPLESWREFFWKKYKDVERQMSNPSDPIEAAKLINDDIKSWFTFDPRFYYHPTDQSLSEMLANKKGRCEDMTNLTIYAMRANGLAVTSDYTPAWANAGNNHAWNAILTSNGEVIPFMGAEANPGEYRLANKLAKVYRKVFSKQKENLIFQPRKQEEVPGWLSGKSYIDVTSDYIEVCDVEIKFKREIPDSVDIAYLCVFNSGEWKPIHWGKIKDRKVVFTEMGKEIAYLPALYLNGKVEPYSEPFVLYTDCSIKEFQPDEQKTITVQLFSTKPFKQEVSPDGTAKTYLTSGKEYELYYWKDSWQSLGKSVAEDKPLIFEKVPQGFFYWLVGKGSDKEEERIFTLEDGKQVWW